MSSALSSTLTSPQLLAARRAARRLALGHYENFVVVALPLPRRLHQDFCNIYGFCRYADDLADLSPNPAVALQRLKEFGEDLRRVYRGQPLHPLLLALRQTVRRHDIPIDPFLQLLDAFEQDQRITRYQNMAQLHDYCQRSANPVGHLVLHLCGYRDPRRRALADCTCTALQLANFWQDVSRDADSGRIYLPLESLQQFKVSQEQILQKRADENYRAMMQYHVRQTAALFAQGRKLLPLLARPYRAAVALYSDGGEAILGRIAAIDYNTLTTRPRVGKWSQLMLLLRRMISP